MKDKLTETQFYRYYALIAKVCQHGPLNAKAVHERFVHNRCVESRRWSVRRERDQESWTFGDVLVDCLVRTYERHGDNPTKAWRGFKCSQTRSIHRYLRMVGASERQRLANQMAALAQAKQAELTPPDGSLAVIIRPATGDWDKDKWMRFGKVGRLPSVDVAANTADEDDICGIWQGIFRALQIRNKPIRETHIGYLENSGYMWP